MITTSKGAPIPEPTDANDVPLYISLLANWVTDRPGITVMTNAVRDALTGADQLWRGRMIYNTTTNRYEYNRVASSGTANWQPVVPRPQPALFIGSGNYTWTKPDGATRVRAILVGAGGGGAIGATGFGGGGGAIVDVTLPADLMASNCALKVGASNGGPSSGATWLNMFGTATSESAASLVAGGGENGTGSAPGAGGTVRFGSASDVTNGGLWVGGPGGTGPTSPLPTNAQAAPGGGHGATSTSATQMSPAGRGAGFRSDNGIPEYGIPGGGGIARGQNGYEPGGGGAGGGSVLSLGGAAAAVLISYFD